MPPCPMCWESDKGWARGVPRVQGEAGEALERHNGNASAPVCTRGTGEVGHLSRCPLGSLSPAGMGAVGAGVGTHCMGTPSVGRRIHKIETPGGQGHLTDVAPYKIGTPGVDTQKTGTPAWADLGLQILRTPQGGDPTFWMPTPPCPSPAPGVPKMPPPTAQSQTQPTKLFSPSHHSQIQPQDSPNATLPIPPTPNLVPKITGSILPPTSLVPVKEIKLKRFLVIC